MGHKNLDAVFNQKILKAASLIDRNSFQKAEALLIPLIKKRPDNKDPLHLLGEIYMRTPGKHQDAINLFKQVLHIDVEDSFAWRNIGIIFFATLNDYNQAISFLTKAYQINPNDGLTLSYLGQVSFKQGLHDDAIALLHSSLKLLPDNVDTLSNLGMAYMVLRDVSKARAFCFRALELCPHLGSAYLNAYNLGNFIELTNEERELLERSAELLKTHPMHGAIVQYHTILNKRGDVPLEETIKDFEELLESNPNDYVIQSAVFDLCHSYDKNRNYDKAFSCALKGNELSLNGPNAKNLSRDVIYQLFTASNHILNKESMVPIVETVTKKNNKPLYPSPVFLMGFPRSGTTLSGRILERHEKIYVADEMDGIRMAQLHFQQQTGIRLPIEIPKMTEEHFILLQEKYDEFQKNEVSNCPKEKLFLDKNPLNSVSSPVLYAAFPHSKFLFVHRHPLDCVISGFMQHFRLNSSMIHMCDIKDIANLYVETYYNWQNQKAFLPISYHEYRYEDLVQDFDNEISKILTFLELEWDDNVRKFYENQKGDKAILTPSKDQITKNLYASSLYRWKNYRKHLEPIIGLLEPIIKELDYSLDD